MIRIALICAAEQRTLGHLNVEPGQAINVAKLGRDFEAIDGPAVADALLETAKDGTPLLCPACRNPVLAAIDGQDMATAIENGAVVQLGATTVKG